MKKLALLPFIGICIISCKPENQKPKTHKDIFVEAVEVGPPIVKEVDEKGGEIAVGVNNSKVIFYPSSVGKATPVSIQPISNPLANFGLGLRISSHYENIKIELAYPQNELPSNSFEIYYAQGIEWIKAENKIIDTVNHTISFVQRPNEKLKKSSSAKVATHVFDYVIGK